MSASVTDLKVSSLEPDRLGTAHPAIPTIIKRSAHLEFITYRPFAILKVAPNSQPLQPPENRKLPKTNPGPIHPRAEPPPPRSPRRAPARASRRGAPATPRAQAPALPHSTTGQMPFPPRA